MHLKCHKNYVINLLSYKDFFVIYFLIAGFKYRVAPIAGILAHHPIPQ